MIMRQFKLYLNLLLLMAIGMVASCNDDFDRPPMMIPSAAHIDKVNTTILDLKTKYWKEDKNYIDTIKLTEAGDSVVIKGRVVSSDESGNIYKNLVIQDETAAITISINGNSLYNTYRIGQEIVLPVTGLFIGKYNTLQQLGYPDYSDTYGWQATFLPLAMFQEAAELNGLPNAAEIDTISVKMAELPTTPDGIRKMQSQLVRFDGVSFVEADGKTTFSESESSTSRNLKDEDSGNTIIVRNSNYANFKSDILPLGVGSVVGILSYYSGAWQLLLRDVDDCIGFDTTIKGSKAEPYTVAEAIEKQGSEKTAWVSGYIVGAVAPEVTEIKSSADIEFTAPTTLANTLVIADAADVKDVTKCIVLSLPQGSQLRSAANLQDEAHKALLGTKIALKGKFAPYMGANGLIGNSGGYDEFVLGDGGGSSEAQGDGTEANPYNVAGVLEFINTLGADTESSAAVYVKGRVSNNSTTESTISSYGNMTFDIVDDGNNEKTFKAFQVYGPGNKKFTSVDQIKVGDNVLIYGKVVNYKGNTPETVGKGQAYVVSINGTGGGDNPGGGDQPSGDAVTAINEGFEGGSVPANWGNVQLKGDKKWYTPSFNNNYYAAMTGYKGTAPFDSWLITPAINMDGVTTKKLSFRTQVNGYGSTTTTMKVFVLTSADPATATRTELNCKWATAPASGYSDWVESGDIDLSSYSGIIYIGFQYAASTDANYATWCVDDVVLGEGGGSTGGGSTGGGETGGETGGGDISGNSITLDLSTLGFENATAVTDVNMSDGTVLTFGSGSNTTNAPKYYTATGGVRMYANNTLNVKASGKTITGVKLTCDSYNGTDYVGNDTLNGKSGSTTVNPSVSGTTVTFSGFSGAELLITNAYAQSSGGVQLRVKTVTVYYAE